MQYKDKELLRNKAQKRLDEMSQWSEANGLALNKNKTTALNVTLGTGFIPVALARRNKHPWCSANISFSRAILAGGPMGCPPNRAGGPGALPWNICENQY